MRIIRIFLQISFITYSCLNGAKKLKLSDFLYNNQENENVITDESVVDNKKFILDLEAVLSNKNKSPSENKKIPSHKRNARVFSDEQDEEIINKISSLALEEENKEQLDPDQETYQQYEPFQKTLNNLINTIIKSKDNCALFKKNILNLESAIEREDEILKKTTIQGERIFINKTVGKNISCKNDIFAFNAIIQGSLNTEKNIVLVNSYVYGTIKSKFGHIILVNSIMNDKVKAKNNIIVVQPSAYKKLQNYTSKKLHSEDGSIIAICADNNGTDIISFQNILVLNSKVGELRSNAGNIDVGMLSSTQSIIAKGSITIKNSTICGNISSLNESITIDESIIKGIIAAKNNIYCLNHVIYKKTITSENGTIKTWK